ncbi:MAG: tRNA pseudouridine(38-40) synthase TruA [Verrucomicrobia bacterium]|nr:tRNA pseudouridine(38-40) synthase TruA [Verrucomicrobiota bacterium]
MLRLKLTLAYDGRPWVGWQSQPGGQTVQDQLEAALQKLTGSRVVVHGSGRTDAGVHARGQVAHIELPEESSLRGESMVRAMNVNLPPSIRVLHCEDASSDFHARFSAKGKVYEYRIWRADVMSPFEVGLAWHVFKGLDIGLLREGAALMCGRHNFARLSAARGDISEEERRENAAGLTRTIQRVEIFDEGDLLRLEFEGEGFLYKMVRLMTGSLVHAARGRATLEWVRQLVQEPEGVKSHHCAPADGLYLLRVLY